MKLRRFVPFALVPLMAASIALVVQPAGAASPPSSTPAWTAATGDIHLSSPAVADVNGDGVKDVVIGTLDRKVHVLDGRNGGELPGWPQTVGGGIEASPTIADLDGNGQMSIIVGFGSLDDRGGQGGLAVFRANGSRRFPDFATRDVFNEWTGGGPDGVREAVVSTPAVGDVTGDGVPDIVFGSFDHFVYVLNRDGAKQMEFDTFDTIWSSPALYDSDGDGRMEIFIGSDASGRFGCGSGAAGAGLMWGLNGDGGQLWHRCQQTIFQSSPVIGDINGDGRMELVTGASSGSSPESNRVFAFHLNDGSDVPGWPQATNGPVMTTPAIGDITGDGKPEVVVSSCSVPCTNPGGSKSQVYAFNGDGSVRWSVVPQPNISQNLSSPVIADLNGDGVNDVAVGCEGEFCLMNGPNGASLGGPIDVNRTHQTAGAVADFGGGLGWRLVVASRLNGGGQVAAFPMSAPGTTPPFPQWRLNAAHVGAPPAPPPIPCTQGYWLGASDGGIFAFGNAGFLGSAGNIPLNQPIVGMSATPNRAGYWLVARDGGIFAFGNAAFKGSTGNIHLNQPIVAMASTPTGGGYWLVAADGGVFAFGDAAFLGSTGNIHLNQPIVGMAATPSGRGYWMVARDGGIFAFGDAAFMGSMGGTHLNQPIVSMASTGNGGGYWMVASDGGIFAFGNAAFKGSTGAIHLNKPIVSMARTVPGNGYWLVATDGGIFAFGDAAFCGSTGNRRLNQPINAMAAAA